MGGTALPEIKVVEENPLTQGLAQGKRIPIAKVSGRRTTNLSAKVAVTSKQKTRKGKPRQGPFLTYKSVGKGACVYLTGHFSTPAEKTMATLVRNALSDETLKWLCVGE